jgi:hypothetical protein
LLRASLKSFDEIAASDKEQVDEPVGTFFLKLPRNIVAKSDPLMSDGADLVKAANRCRIIPGGFADYIKDESKKPINPVGRLRRQRTHELLLWQAERTHADHWFEPGPRSDDPWYAVAGKAYLDSARGLFDDEQIPDALVKNADRVKSKYVPTQLRVGKLGNLNWTTETDYTLAYQVLADKGLPEGTPMVWLEVTSGKVTEKIWPRRPMTSWPKFDDVFALDHPSFTSDSVVMVTLHAYYRGQHVRESAPSVRTPPNVIVRHAPALKENTSLAVRMDSGFDYGAISIVLDNSGSMKYRYPRKGNTDEQVNRPNRRFDQALNGLEHVLRKVPDKTYLSIFALGEKNPAKPVPLRAPVPWFQDKFPALRASLEDLPADIGSPIAEGLIKAMDEGFPNDFPGPKVVLVLTDGDDNSSFTKDDNLRNNRIAEELKAAAKRNPETTVIVVCFINKNLDAKANGEYESAKAQFGVVEQFKRPGQFLDVPDGEKLGSVIEDLLRPRAQLLTLAEQEPVVGFQDGLPINYHNDRALNWKKTNPGEFYAHVLRTAPNPHVNVELAPGQKLFLTLNRTNEKLSLRRGILAYQPETEKRGEWRREKEGWVVTLLESENRGLKTSILKQLLAIEKKEHEKDRIRQAVPGLAWLELDVASGTRPDKTLRWWRDWNVPAPAYRVEMRDWLPSSTPKITTWFWPEDREKFFENQEMILHATRPVPYLQKNSPDALEGPVIEYVDWKEREIEDPRGDRVKKNCLIVRVRHPKGRPVWVDLEHRPPGVGSEHHYFWSANSCTTYFYGMTRLETANLALVDLTAFKAAAQRAEFSPDVRIEAPRMFVPETP